MADIEYFEWLGDADVAKLPFVHRELSGVMFSGPDHIGATGDKDKIRYFSDSKYFKKSTKTAFELAGGRSVEDVIETAPVSSTGNPDEKGSSTLG